jgi:hypothetical protein
MCMYGEKEKEREREERRKTERKRERMRERERNSMYRGRNGGERRKMVWLARSTLTD